MNSEGHLSAEASVADGTARLVLSGELDLNGVDPVTAELERLAAQDVTTVLVDASGLTFLDSSGLRALLAGREKLKAAGATMQVVDASTAVTRVLDMTGTRSLLEG